MGIRYHTYLARYPCLSRVCVVLPYVGSRIPHSLGVKFSVPLLHVGMISAREHFPALSRRSVAKFHLPLLQPMRGSSCKTPWSCLHKNTGNAGRNGVGACLSDFLSTKLRPCPRLQGLSKLQSATFAFRTQRELSQALYQGVTPIWIFDLARLRQVIKAINSCAQKALGTAEALKTFGLISVLSGVEK